MHVASLSPLSVGGLPWSAPEPCYTVVLKATFSLEQDGPLNLHLQQSPLCHEQAGPRPNELFYGSDFLPRKVGVDVAMVGHARSPRPEKVVPFSLALGDLAVRLYAVADTPSRAIPLWSDFVRRRPDEPRSALQLAPRPTATRSWRNHLIASHFDFTAFNTADPALRLDEMPLDAVLRLEGLLCSAAVREVLIGDTQPYVFYVRDCRARDEADLLFPACDTVWIDTDRERLTLSWRCEVRPEGPQESPFLAVVLGTRRVPPKWPEVRRRLSRARWHEAVEPTAPSWSLLEAGPFGAFAVPPPAPSSHAQMVRRRAYPSVDRPSTSGEDWSSHPGDYPGDSHPGYDGPPTPRASQRTTWAMAAPAEASPASGDGRSVDDRADTPRTHDGVATPRTHDGVATPRTHDGVATPRTYDGPATPRSLDDAAPLTPRALDSDHTVPLGGLEITERVRDHDDERTARLPPVAPGPDTRRDFDLAELQSFVDETPRPPAQRRRPPKQTLPLPPEEPEPSDTTQAFDDDEPSEPRRHTMPCPPAEEPPESGDG